MSGTLKQFFNRKTQKWHILEHQPESKSRIKWKVIETRDLKHPTAEITGRFSPKEPEQPEQPEQPEKSDISDTSLKQEQNKANKNESGRSKGFLGIF